MVLWLFNDPRILFAIFLNNVRVEWQRSGSDIDVAFTVIWFNESLDDEFKLTRASPSAAVGDICEEAYGIKIACGWRQIRVQRALKDDGV
jgi:hypothetical protein